MTPKEYNDAVENTILALKDLDHKLLTLPNTRPYDKARLQAQRIGVAKSKIRACIFALGGAYTIEGTYNIQL